MNEDLGKLILRVTVGGLLIFHGISKLVHGIAWMAGPLSAAHIPFFVGYGVYLAEVVAPIFIILGYRTRISALVVAFDLLMAILLVVKARIFQVNPGGGWGIETEAFYLLSALAIFFLGAGRYSVTRVSSSRWD